MYLIGQSSALVDDIALCRGQVQLFLQDSCLYDMDLFSQHQRLHLRDVLVLYLLSSWACENTLQPLIKLL